MRALSIRQPYAEAIMRGTKTSEFRSGPTSIRGRGLIYDALGQCFGIRLSDAMREFLYSG